MISKANKDELSETNKVEYMSKLRIIKKNLIHIHGIPKSLAIINLLKTDEYLGKYGKIVRFIMSYKINQENNKRFYSVYVTYSNELEAALAILCVDSILIQGKIIRAFFGTTKYCNYFLNNSICPNINNCIYLHQLISDNDIIINNNDNNSFSYNDHLNLAKKIINKSNLKANDLFKNTKILEKNIFPPISFIFLNEEEKEKYFKTSDIGYIKTNNIIIKDNVILNNLNNFNESKKNLIFYSDSNNNNQKEIILGGNNYTGNSNLNFSNKEKYECLTTNNFSKDKKNYSNSLAAIELHNIFQNSTNHILFAKPFYLALKNINLKKLELEYFIKDLTKKGLDIYELLDGCLDPIKNII